MISRIVWAVLLLLATTAAAEAENTVTVGAIFPLAQELGPRAAIETAAEIVNAPHPGLEWLPLGAGQGLPNLAGAKIAVTFADSLANPSVAQSQALWLITKDRVAALIGGGDTAEVLAASGTAEHHGAPFLVPDATAPEITARGFHWVFRTTPLESDIARVYARFLGQAAPQVHSVALVVEDSDFGRARAAALGDGLTAAGFAVGNIAYPAKATDLSAPVAQLQRLNPDAAIFVSLADGAILFAKTMKNAGYKPSILIGDDAGFSDPRFAASVGNLAQGAIDRSAWNFGAAGSPTALVNNLYKAKSGRDLDDEAARVMQGFFVLADAIDRAGATDPAAIRKALRDTDLKPAQLIVGDDGVKFDAAGQNTLGSTYLTQLQGKQYVPVWPPDRAAGKLALPFKGWE